MIPQSWYWNY